MDEVSYTASLTLFHSFSAMGDVLAKEAMLSGDARGMNLESPKLL